MKLEEARQKVAKKYLHANSWDCPSRQEMYVEAIELFRAHWEAVGIQYGLRRALTIVESQTTYWPDSHYMEEKEDATWIAGDTLQDALNAEIELSKTN